MAPFLQIPLGQPGATLRSVSQAVEKWLPVFPADPRVTATPHAEVGGSRAGRTAFARRGGGGLPVLPKVPGP